MRFYIFLPLILSVCAIIIGFLLKIKRLREDEKRLDWLECRAMNKYLLGFWADNGGTLRDAIDAEMK